MNWRWKVDNNVDPDVIEGLHASIVAIFWIDCIYPDHVCSQLLHQGRIQFALFTVGETIQDDRGTTYLIVDPLVDSMMRKYGVKTRQDWHEESYLG